MKILFDNCNFNSRSGPNSFATRLAKAIAERGHTLADPDDFDVALSFIEPTQHVLDSGRPFVQRLDGIWFKPEQFYTHNVNIKRAYSRAYAVVFQSEFDQNFITKWWGKPSTLSKTINNGISKTEIKEAINLSSKRFTDLSRLREQYDKLFVCSANWHSQKRLKTNLELFSHVVNNLNVKACLMILGENSNIEVNKVLAPHVFFAGSISHAACVQVYAQCDYMFHCAWLDHCPNVVVECLMSGTPVVCSSEGGTKEIVQDGGVVLNDYEAWNMEPTNYDNPPALNVKQLDMSFLDKKVSEQTVEKLDIDNVVKRYENVLVSIL